MANTDHAPCRAGQRGSALPTQHPEASFLIHFGKVFDRRLATAHRSYRLRTWRNAAVGEGIEDRPPELAHDLAVRGESADRNGLQGADGPHDSLGICKTALFAPMRRL